MIRPLTIEELAQYVPRLQEAAGQLVPCRPMNPTRFLEKWTSWYAMGVGCVFGYWRGNKLGGTLGALISDDLYDDSPIAVEVFLNIRPEARMYLGWRKLIPAYRAWAMEQGATKIYLSRWASCPKLDRLYHKLNFVPSEVHYRLEV